MESFIAAHLGEREVEDEMKGEDRNTATADPFKYISYPPTYTCTHNNLCIFSIGLLSFIINSHIPLTAQT